MHAFGWGRRDAILAGAQKPVFIACDGKKRSNLDKTCPNKTSAFERAALIQIGLNLIFARLRRTGLSIAVTASLKEN
jgi:hypothetical protein